MIQTLALEGKGQLAAIMLCLSSVEYERNVPRRRLKIFLNSHLRASTLN
jgi:hypothetical protein